MSEHCLVSNRYKDRAVKTQVQQLSEGPRQPRYHDKENQTLGKTQANIRQDQIHS